MTPEEFKKILELAAKQVESWPIWKQNIIRDSLNPKVPEPRPYVDNSEGRNNDGW